jgi:hypothetical protein
MAAARSAARAGAEAPGAPPTTLLGPAGDAGRLLKPHRLAEPRPSHPAPTTAPSA